MGAGKNFTCDISQVLEGLNPEEEVNDVVDDYYSIKGVDWDLDDFQVVLEEDIIDNSNDVNLIVGRQVPTAKAETAVYVGLTEVLDDRIDGEVDLRIPPFTRDMMVKNPEKLSYLNMPFIENGEMSEVSLGSINCRKTIGSHSYKVNGQGEALNQVSGLNIPQGDHGLVPIHNSIIDGDISCVGDISNVHSRVIEEMIQNDNPPSQLWMENDDGSTQKLCWENGSYQGDGETFKAQEVMENGFLSAQDAYDLIIYPTSLVEDTIYMLRDGVPDDEKFYSKSAGKLEANLMAASELNGYPILDIGEPADKAPSEIKDLLDDSSISNDMRFGDDSTVHVSVYPTADQWKSYREELNQFSKEDSEDAEQIASILAEKLYSTMI